MRIQTAIFPVAGRGSRFLPATKALPKELLPVLNKPVLQYAIEEAKAAGVETFIFVHARGKEALVNHIDSHPELERELEAAGKPDLAEAVRAASIPAGDAIFVRQAEPLGLGHAVHCARRYVGDGPVAVLLPDDVFLNGEAACLAEMAAAYRPEMGSMVAVERVPYEQTRKYGVLAPISEQGRVVTAKTMVEKPEPDEAPSNLAVAGRYILPPEIMPALAQTKPGRGGEIQLTDAIAALADSHGLCGFRFSAQRYDCGSVAGFVQANLAQAMADPELRRMIEAMVDGQRLRGAA